MGDPDRPTCPPSQVLDELKAALGRSDQEDPLVQQLWFQLKTLPVQGSEAAIHETLRSASISPTRLASLVLPEGVFDAIQQLSWALAVAQITSQQASEEQLLQAIDLAGQQGTQIPTSLLHSLLLHARSTAESFPELLPAALRLPSSNSHILLPLIGTHPAANLEAGKMVADVVKATGLAGVMEDLGFACTINEQAFADVLNQFESLDEASVARVLGMMSRTHAADQDQHDTQASLAAALGGSALPEQPWDGSKSWNVDLVIDMLKRAAPQLQLYGVMENLDFEGFNVPDAKGFLVLMTAWKRLSSEAFPLQAIIGKLWNNGQGQLSFLRHAVTAPPDVFTFEHAPQKVAPLEGLAGGKSPVGLPNQAWLCLDLLDTLSRLAEAGHHQTVQQILDQPIKHCPEVLLVGLASVHTGWGILQREVCGALAAVYVDSHPNSSLVLHRIWPVNQEVVLRGMVALYEAADTHISRVLDVCTELNALRVVLDSTPVGFAIELVALAAQRELVNLDQWLQDRVAFHRQPFLQALLQFVVRKVQNQQLGNRGAGGVNVSLEVLVLMMRTLQSNVMGLPPESGGELAHLKHKVVGLHPELQSVIMDSPAPANTFPAPAGTFPQDVENEANTNFQQVYQGAESVEQLMARLRSMKDSSDPREQEVFSCMINNLFDEYRFFHKYPDKELQITAALFGSLISQQLIEQRFLGEALRYLLDALVHPAGHKMCTFALQALHKFRDHLSKWPSYCKALLQVPNIQEKDPELAKAAESILQDVSEGRGAPPGFEPAVTACAPADMSTVQPDAEMGVRLAELALADPTPAPTLAAVQAGADPALPSGQAGGQQMTAPGGQEVKLLPLTQPGKTADAESSAVPGSSPFSAPAVQASPAKLPSSPRLLGSSTDGGARPASTTRQSAMDHNRAFGAIDASTLEVAAQEVDYPLPPHKIQDKIGFLINNLSAANLEQKAKDLGGLLTEEQWPWFCNYMVVKRAAQEPNFHSLYVNLLLALQKKELFRMMVTTTYKYVRILLASERIKTQSGERSLLKNLGSWLGRITIAQGQPVRHKDLDIKGIVMDAYEQGKMIAVLPFVNKVLEPCKDSKVFRPPNPWIIGILALMAEIYAQDKLKLNLTFEIEMLFRNFNLQISDTRVTSELASRKRDTISGTDFTLDKPAATEPAGGQSAGMPPASPARSLPPVEPSPMPTPATAVGTPPGASPARTHASQEQQRAAASEPSTAHTPPAAPPAPAAVDQGLFANLHNYVVLNPSLQPVAEQLQLKRLVPVAVDRAIVEIITPVVERSVTIACMTTQELIIKDFALEADETHMRKSAHLMVSSLAGSLALVTCREPLRSSLATQLRHLLSPSMDGTQLEHTVQVITGDNFELGCSIIEKAATDRAVRDIDDRLLLAYQARQKAKSTGQPFFDAAVLQGRFPSSLPEALRPKPGHMSLQQQRVYEDFARIPRAAAAAVAAAGAGPGSVAGSLGPTSPRKPPGSEKAASLASGDHSTLDEGTLAMAQLSEACTLWQQRMEVLVAKDAQGPLTEGSELATVVAEVLDLAPEGQEEQNLLISRKIFQRMAEVTGARLHLAASVAALSALRTRLPVRLPTELVNWWAGLPDPARWRRDVVEALLKARLMHAPELDNQLAKILNNTRPPAAMHFVVELVRNCLIVEPVAATAADFYNTLELLSKVAAHSPAGTQLQLQLQQLVIQARNRSHVPADVINDGTDPSGLKEQVKVTEVINEWVRISDDDSADQIHRAFVAKLQQCGFLKGDDLTDHFIRMMTQMAVTHSLSQEAQATSAGRPTSLNYLVLDAYVRLVCMLIRVHGGGVPLLAKVTSVLTKVLQRDAELRLSDFNGRPYYRILLGLIQELSPADVSEEGAFGTLSTLASALLSVQPLQVPGFSFPWLELISHRNLMPKLLLVPGQKGWPHFQSLLVALLRFLEPYLRNAELTDAVRLLYKGTLRVLLVLLHDFPEFLCEYHFEICNVVPPSCIQMRNLILSAFPRNMRLPDPFTPNLKVDLLPEISGAPRFRPPAQELLPPQLCAEVDSYLRLRQPESFLQSLRQRLLLPAQDVALYGTRYNCPLLNALVFYVGVQAIAQLQTTPGSSPVMHSPPMDIFQRLALDLDTEGRYLFLNALANQLRYPNNHTHYFSCVLLFLFAEANQEIIQEQITRVLLERLIVNRPHPWGLLISFIELIKNPRYNFWSYNFTRCAGEIERLFDSVARSCMGTGKGEEDLHPGKLETA